MGVDTEAAVSIISEQTKKILYPSVSLTAPSVVLHTYTGKAIKVLDEMKVQVKYQDQSHDATLMVVKGDGPTFLGEIRFNISS